MSARQTSAFITELDTRMVPTPYMYDTASFIKHDKSGDACWENLPIDLNQIAVVRKRQAINLAFGSSDGVVAAEYDLLIVKVDLSLRVGDIRGSRE